MSYLFSDLEQIEAPKIPSLNSIVSITIQDGGSSLTISESSQQFNQSKIISGFLNTLDNSDLFEMNALLDSCRSELSAKIENLKKQRLN